jgi:transposase
VGNEDENLSRSELLVMVEQLRAMVERQEQQIAELKRDVAALRKNSSNSSKPPSSDIVKPPQNAGQGKDKRKKRRKRGGQPGHPMHDRPPFEADQVSATEVHELSGCPCCGGAVELTDNAPRVLQKVELIEQVPWIVTEHQAHAYYCPQCQRVHYASIPPEIERGGMLGPRLMALIAYMKGAQHASFSTIRKYLRDVLKLPISRSRLAKAIDQVSQSLKYAHDELGDLLPHQPTLRVDETGHKDNGQRHWTWCFRAELFTWFHIDSTRSSQVLFDVLGEEFEGVISCDYFSAYRKYMHDCDVLVQFCLAHLIRDLKYLTTLPDSKTAAYGRRLLEHVRELFEVIHKGQSLTAATLAARLRQRSDQIIRSATTRVPDRSEAQAIATRFEKHGQAYFQFITTPGIEPTNNLAEQALRFVVIDRHITQGTRSDKGQRWSERIWTVLATCTQQGRSIMQFLIDATTAWVQGQPPPTLLPDPIPA